MSGRKEECDELRAAAEDMAERAPGHWKLWGVDVMADPTGTSDYDLATDVVSAPWFVDGRLRTHLAAYIAAVDPPAVLGLLDALEAAEGRLRDLTRRLGFGDGITEPQADNDTIVAFYDEQGREANEWHEHQRWLNDCAEAGCDPLEDCPTHAPLCHSAHAQTGPPEPHTRPLSAEQPERDDFPSGEADCAHRWVEWDWQNRSNDKRRQCRVCGSVERVTS